MLKFFLATIIWLKLTSRNSPWKEPNRLLQTQKWSVCTQRSLSGASREETSSLRDLFYPSWKKIYPLFPASTRLFPCAGSKPVGSSPFVGTLVFSQAPATRVGCRVWQSWRTGDPTATSKPGSASGGLGGEAGYADGSLLTGVQHPGMSAVLCRAAQGLICGLEVKETWAPLMKSGQGVTESLSVYILLVA